MEARKRRRRPGRKADHLEHAFRAARSGRRNNLLSIPPIPRMRHAPTYLQANVGAGPLLESRNWRLDLDELAAQRLATRTKVIVINSPAQSDRRRPDQERLASRSPTCAERTISSSSPTRSTAATVYTGARSFRSRSCAGMRERTIVVDGFSKAYAMTGWRLGYGIMPERLAATRNAVQQQHVSCVATFVQMAGIAALDRPRRTRPAR